MDKSKTPSVPDVDLSELDEGDLVLMLIDAATTISQMADEVERAFVEHKKHPAAVLVAPKVRIHTNIPPKPVLAGIVLPTNILVPFRDLSRAINALFETEPSADDVNESDSIN